MSIQSQHSSFHPVFLAILIGLSTFWFGYFCMLFLLDQLIGAQQLSQQLLLEGKRSVLDEVVKSAIGTAIFVALASASYLLLAKAIASLEHPHRIWLAAGAVFSATAATLFSLGFTLPETLPFLSGTFLALTALTFFTIKR